MFSAEPLHKLKRLLRLVRRAACWNCMCSQREDHRVERWERSRDHSE